MKGKTALSCIICKGDDVEKFWASLGYKLARCKDCGMVWDPFPPESALSLYDKNYFINENPKGGYANYFEGMRINKKTFADRLRKLERELGKKGNLLDVGCALGDCLLEAGKLGWKEAQGIEVADYAYKFAKRRGLRVRKGELDSFHFPNESFDAVTYQDVIEHLKDPLSELKNVYEILKPGGIIFIVTPDISGLWSRLLGPLWYHYKPGEHLNYFSQKSISFILRESGFKKITTSKTYHILSLKYILNRLKYYYPIVFDFLLALVVKTPLKDKPFKSYTGELEAWGQKPN